MVSRIIRPLTSGELLDLPFGLLRVLWWRLTLISLMSSAPLAVAQILLILPVLALLPFDHPLLLAGSIVPLIVTRWQGFALALVLQPLHALPRAAAARLVAARACGLTLSVREAWRTSWRAGLRLALLSIPLAALQLLSVLVLIGLPGLGLLLWCFGLLPVLTGWGFVAEIVTLENLPLRAVLGRSWRLTRRHLARTTAHVLVAESLMIIVTLVPIALLSFADIIFSVGYSLFATAGLAVASVMALALSGWRPCSRGLAYLELRARTEGLDIQMSLGTSP
ncbi:MAG: hypothetical protein ABIQ99_12970 [Thermoflexales bacterium]